MKKITLRILFTFLFFTNFVNSQVTSGMFNVSVNNVPIENCTTIALGNNTSVTVSFTLRVTRPSSSTDVGSAAKYRIFLKRNSSATPIELNGILVNNSAFSGGTTWEGTFSQTIDASSIDVTGSNFYGEYSHTAGNSPAKTCIYKLTKNPSPTFELSPTSQPIYCDSKSEYRFTVNNVYNSPGTLSYTWYVGYGWSRNGVPVNGGSFTTTENYIYLKPTNHTVVPQTVQVVPVFNGVSQPVKACSTARSGFSPSLLTIAGKASMCYQSAPEIYSIPDLYNDLTVSWSSSNNSIATVTNSGNQAIVTPVSKGFFTLTGLVANACGQTYAIKKDVGIVSSPVANFTGEKVQQYIYEYRGQDLYDDLSTYTWENVSSTPYVDFNNMGNRVLITGFPPFSITLKLTATNDCGSDVIYTTLSLNTEDEEINRVANPNNPEVTPTNALDKPSLVKISEVYPNPSNNVVNIKIKDTNSNIKKSKITAKLFDLSGNQKSEIKIENEITPLSVQGFPKGIYILKVNNNGKEEINKIIIN